MWLDDSHKHSDCGEKAQATDGRVLHQPAHGRSGPNPSWRASLAVGGVANQRTLRSTSDTAGDGGGEARLHQLGGHGDGARVLLLGGAAAWRYWRQTGRQEHAARPGTICELFYALIGADEGVATLPKTAGTHVECFSLLEGSISCNLLMNKRQCISLYVYCNFITQALHLGRD